MCCVCAHDYSHKEMMGWFKEHGIVAPTLQLGGSSSERNGVFATDTIEVLNIQHNLNLPGRRKAP